MAKLLFEHRTCGRCGGSGQWGYGRHCYGCGGHGATLTKRGAAAQRYLDAMRHRTFADLEVGHEYLDSGPFGDRADWLRIEAIEHDATRGTIILTSRATGDPTAVEHRYTGFPTTTVRVRCSKVEARAQREQALAYQATLTAKGTPAAARP